MKTPFQTSLVLLILLINVGTRNAFSLECHYGSKEYYKRSAQLRGKTNKRKIECEDDSYKCARVHYRGTENENGDLVSGHQASCLNVSKCGYPAPCGLGLLKNLSSTQGLNVTTCKTICCEGNMCNHHNHKQGTNQLSRELKQEMLWCYDIYKETNNREVLYEEMSETVCTHQGGEPRLDKAARCLTIQETFTNITTQEARVITFGGCIVADMCISACEKFASKAEANTEISCESKCCSGQLCNSCNNLEMPLLLMLSVVLTLISMN